MESTPCAVFYSFKDSDHNGAVSDWADAPCTEAIVPVAAAAGSSPEPDSLCWMSFPLSLCPVSCLSTLYYH